MQDEEKQSGGRILPFVEGERRKEDRRHSDRQGKYDRRKNRCGHCQYFEVRTSAEQGFCQRHHIAIAAETFGCPQFSPASPEPRRP
jgi:hypothetical protein